METLSVEANADKVIRPAKKSDIPLQRKKGSSSRRHAQLTTKPCIVMITSEYPPFVIGGLGTHVHQLVTGLKNKKCDVYVLSYSPDKSDGYRDGNITVSFVTGLSWREGDSSDVSPKELSKLNAEIVRHARQLLASDGKIPDLVHCHTVRAWQASCVLSSCYGIPLVSTVHSLHEPFRRMWGETPPETIIQGENALYRASDYLIAVSQATKNDIAAIHGVQTARIEVIYNGLDCKTFQTMAEQEAAPNICTQKERLPPLIVFAGRIDPQKGITALIRSAMSLCRSWPMAQYVIAGEAFISDYGRSVQALVNQHPALRNSVKFVGKLPRPQLARLYRRATMAVVPSLYEPFGYAAVEAMCLGVPVIATRTGGLTEIIEHGATGLLVPLKKDGNSCDVDVPILTKMQEYLLADRHLALRLGMAGRAHTENEFTLQRMVDRTHAFYSRILAYLR